MQPPCIEPCLCAGWDLCDLLQRAGCMYQTMYSILGNEVLAWLWQDETNAGGTVPLCGYCEAVKLCHISVGTVRFQKRWCCWCGFN